MTRAPHTNPFRYGALALDEAFTDREREVAELESDIVNGQDVVLVAPRRYGKSSLVWRVAQRLIARDVLVGQVNLMTTPTKAKLAEKLATTMYEDLASALFRAKERLRVFQGLRIQPTVSIDPVDGSLSFSFAGGREPQDIDATLERLLELPGILAGERNRTVALVLDEFQEVDLIDPGLPKLLRSVFQQQPEVAHVYLGSRRHMMEQIFNDENEPFWRSAKSMDLGVIDPLLFRPYIERRLAETSRPADPAVVERMLSITGGHPYSTQELCYFLWQETPQGDAATAERLTVAVAKLLDAENAHFSLTWGRAPRVQRQLLQALAREPGHPLTGEYRRRHDLPSSSAIQRALGALEREELIERTEGAARISEPFLAQWIARSAE